MTETINVEQTIDSKLELIKQIGQVESEIKDHITSDFVYAKLNEKDKTFILKMYQNASLARTLLERLRINQKKEWQWNQNKYQWEYQNISQKKEQILKELTKQIFQTFMRTIFMLVILNRNVKDNHLVKWSIGITEEENQQEEEPTGILQKLQNKLKNEEKKE